MDTSKTYIKMSDCPEIQEEIPLANNGGYEHRLWLACPECHVIMVEDDGSYYGCSHAGQVEFIWLPRQDQLQEMVYKNRNPFEIVHGLRQWILGLHAEYGSMEQLWLAFVMKEKYNKARNGSEWT